VGGKCRVTEPTLPQLASHAPDELRTRWSRAYLLLLLAYQVESARLHTKLDDMRSDLRLVIDAYKKKKTG
jgi:hypothetical protein